MPNEKHLLKIDDRPVPEAPSEIRLVACMRNEKTRMPFLLDYYRRLGVNRFLMVDDHSTDGTREYLLSQPDCHVFDPRTRYDETKAGAAWQNELNDDYCTGQWGLTVDSDELLVYPHCEKIKLKEFCAFLDSEGAEAFFTFMLDFYPDYDLSQAECVPGKPFYEICSYFDRDYTFRPRMKLLLNRHLQFPPEEVFGGPRMRKFYPEQLNPSSFNQIRLRLWWKMVKLMEKAGLKFEDKPHKAPTLYKVPLVKWSKGMSRLTSHHIVEPKHGGLSAVTGVLLHFKFFADFHNRALDAVKRGQHYGGAIEYRRYLLNVSRNPNVSFMYPGSVRYENSATVLNAGLMRSSPAYDKYAQ